MKRHQMAKAKNVRQKGSALIEFALCLTFFWTPLFLGTYQIGFNLVRAVQVTQICRDAGHMYSQGADFSNASYQNLLHGLMPSSFYPTASGNTVLYMSTITYVDSAACTAGGLSANNTSCPNLGNAVFSRQIPYGNTKLRASAFGTPSANIEDGSYNISSAYYLKDPSAVANGFLSVISLNSSSQHAYVSEMYVKSNDISFWSYLGISGEYARSIF